MKRYTIWILITLAVAVGCTKPKTAVEPNPTPDLFKTMVHYNGTDSVLITVKPSPEAAGKLIIRPSCENVSLKLVCGKGDNAREVRFNPRGSMGRAVGIGCPASQPCPEGDPGCDSGRIDVIQIPDDSKTIEPLFVECSVRELFDLSPEELGVPVEPEGKSVNCRIEGRFNTKGIVDPSPPIANFRSFPTPGSVVNPESRSSSSIVTAAGSKLDFMDTKYTWCLDEEGRVPLFGVDQELDPAKVFFTFPKGWPKIPANIARVPWMFSGAISNAEANLDWTKVSDRPKKKGPPSPMDGLDDDGFANTSEVEGFDLANSMLLTGGTYPGQTASHMTTCSGPGDPNRNYCVYYNDKEVFVVLRPLSSGSYFPNMDSATELNWFFEKISAPADTTNGGLGIDVHPLSQPAGILNKKVSNSFSDMEEAIRINETSEPMGSTVILASEAVGVPNEVQNIFVHTQRIRQYICEVCGGEYDNGTCSGNKSTFGTDNCKSATPVVAWGEDLVREFTKYVTQHEIGHSLNLVVPSPSGQWHHHPPVDNDDLNKRMLMRPYAYYKAQGTKVTFYLPDYFCSECRSKRDLTVN